jgi:hypothetical protein
MTYQIRSQIPNRRGGALSTTFPTHLLLPPSNKPMSLCGSSSTKPSFGRGRPVRFLGGLEGDVPTLTRHLTVTAQSCRMWRWRMWSAGLYPSSGEYPILTPRNSRQDVAPKRVHAWLFHTSLARPSFFFGYESSPINWNE